MISQTAEYALRAIVYIAENPAQARTTAQIAAATGVKQAYLSKVKDFQGVAHVYSFDDKRNGVHDVAVVKFRPGTKDMEYIETITVK